MKRVDLGHEGVRSGFVRTAPSDDLIYATTVRDRTTIWRLVP